jgi:hypothetical protein
MRRAGFLAASAGAASLLGFMKSNMLTGQRLRVRTGKLRSNWHQMLPRNEGPIEAHVATNTEYAPVQEYGFSGTAQVGAFTRNPPRRRTKSGRLVRSKRGKLGEGGLVSVKAHSRQMNIRPKWYLRDSVRFHESRVAEIVRRYLVRGWNGQQS